MRVFLEYTKRASFMLPHFVLTLCIIGLSFLFPSSANAGFVGYYAIGNFTLTNTNADGFADTPDAGLSIVLTGGNNGSGLSGLTDFTIGVALTGLVHYSYSFSTVDDPGFDWAGSLLDGAYSPFATPQGTFAMFLSAGHTFGFRVETLDNGGGPGVLAISDFSAPQAVVASPEPGFAPGLLVLGAIAMMRKLLRGYICSAGKEVA